MPYRAKDGSSAIRSQDSAAPGSSHDDLLPALMALRQIIEAGCLLTESEAARFLGLSVKTLQRWRVGRRGVRWIKLERAVRYDPADLVAYIEAGRRTPSRDSALP
jgi:hypothetical protein